jgi:hypothetical protein
MLVVLDLAILLIGLEVLEISRSSSEASSVAQMEHEQQQ